MVNIGQGVALYFGTGLSLHLFIWIFEVLRSIVCPTNWPDVEVEPRRLSEGGPAAKHGEGHEGYYYDTEGWNAYARTKLVFTIVTGLLPVRCIIFVLSFAWALIWCVIGAHLSAGTCAFTAARFMFALGCKGLCTSVACYASEVQGREHIKWINQPGGPHPIIVPNHITYVEVVHLHWLTRGMSGVMAKSMEGGFGIKYAVRFLKGIIADPKDPQTKEKFTAGIMNFVENKPSADGRYPFAGAFTIYPEGITGSQHGLFRFNTGAFAPGQPVLPCVQRFPYRHMNPAWVSKSKISAGNYGYAQMLRYMTQFTMPLQVKFLPVYEPTRAEIEDPTVFANNVQNYMALQLDVVATDTSYKILRESNGPFDLKKKKSPENVLEKPLMRV